MSITNNIFATGYIDKINLAFYDDHFSQEGLIHRYPNVNTVRCELWYFRKNNSPGKILDYGFGYGREAIYFAENGYDVYGLDISPVAQKRFQIMLSTEYVHLKDKIRTSIINASDEKLPYEDNFFDFIHSNQVIYHLPSAKAIRGLIKEWYRVLKPGGKLMFSTIGLQASCIQGSKEVEENIFEKEYKTPNMKEPMKMRCYVMKDTDAIRSFCEPLFTLDEIGWFTNHYCGIDGFHWQVLARKEK